MKRRHAAEKPIIFRKLLRFAVPVLFLAAMLSCFFSQGQAFWNGLLKKAELTHFTSSLSEDELHIHVIDVGKADAILIESTEAAVLVDTGTRDSAETVERYLSARGIKALDAVWISHGDSDHVGGLEVLLQSVTVKEIVQSPYSVLPETKTASAGDVWEYGSMTFEVLGPMRSYEAENDNSLVFRMRYGDFTMLFCGDIEVKAEKDLLDSYTELHADVLKIAHHGSDTSTSEDFLAAVDPKYAVISVGEDRNNLPRNAVLKRLHDAEIPYYRTDESGSIVISTDGKCIQITTENTGANAGA